MGTKEQAVGQAGQTLDQPAGRGRQLQQREAQAGRPQQRLRSGSHARRGLQLVAALAMAVAAQLLLPQPSAEAQAVDCSRWNQPTSYVKNWNGQVKGGPWNIRRGPSLAGACDTGKNAHADDSVVVHAQTGDWYFIENKSRSQWGWISKRAVGGVSSGGGAGGVDCSRWNQPTSYVKNWNGQVKGGPWNVRRGPSGAGACDTGKNAHAGDLVVVHARTGDWYFVENKSRSQWGWISTRAIGGVSSGGGGNGVDCSRWNQPTSYVKNWGASIKNGPWNVRRGPSLAGACDTGRNAWNGDWVIVHSRLGSWYFVENKTRNDWGWISTQAIHGIDYRQVRVDHTKFDIEWPKVRLNGGTFSKASAVQATLGDIGNALSSVGRKQ